MFYNCRKKTCQFFCQVPHMSPSNGGLSLDKGPGCCAVKLINGTWKYQHNRERRAVVWPLAAELLDEHGAQLKKLEGVRVRPL